MRHIGVCLAVVSLTGSLGSAHAAGFALRTGSADWVANAYAGNTAKSYDASTSWTNPAGMVRLDQNEIDASINGLFPRTEPSVTNFGAGGRPTPGIGSPGNSIQSAATAGTFGVLSVTRDLKLGLAVTAPFGERIAYPNDWVGRYQSLVSSITDIQALLSAAYRIDSHFSVGAGVVLDYFQTRLTQAVNIGTPGLDPVLDLHGHDVAAGYVLSGLFQLTPATRFGLTYRSRIEHDIGGGQRVYVPPLIAAASPVTAARLLGLSSSLRTQITLPDSVTFGAYHDITPRLAIMADVQWTDWSLLNTVAIVPGNPGVPPATLALNLRNSWFGSVGANYKVTNTLMLQAGVAYDQTPVRDSASRSSRLPDYDRWELGAGFTYAAFSNVKLQFGYAHEFAGNVSIRNAASTTSGVLAGTYRDSADIVSLGAAVKF